MVVTYLEITQIRYFVESAMCRHCRFFSLHPKQHDILRHSRSVYGRRRVGGEGRRSVRGPVPGLCDRERRAGLYQPPRSVGCPQPLELGGAVEHISGSLSLPSGGRGAAVERGVPSGACERRCPTRRRGPLSLYTGYRSTEPPEASAASQRCLLGRDSSCCDLVYSGRRQRPGTTDLSDC